MKQHQAAELETLFNTKDKRNFSATRFIAITSGKGGVGKSSISANLAYGLHKLGKKVAVFDADIGLANLDLIFGIKVEHNILHALKGEVSFSEVIYQIEKGLFLIPGESGEEILKYANSGVFERFLEETNVLQDLDYMIIDTGAGIGGVTQSFLDASDLLIVVTMRDPSALMDAYATIKLNAKTKNDIALIVNMTQSAKEANAIYERIKNVGKEKIPNLRLHYLGHLTQSTTITKATRARELFYKAEPLSASRLQIDSIIKQILLVETKLFGGNNVEQNMLQAESTFNSFLRRMLGYL
ncbi:MAG: P-loop NTPase [Helicobacter sp.]|uniref:P-loop NTPase n=1 Tax=Helicobacter sp. 10-6591 TaxID=2004998 RepID=UPI000DCC0EC5|nr:P-loop NTPase [Helicobacter sp. 10-6591]MCI7485573.1 P-loop NTPase [Helicobacter sp.]MDD7567429.1 P-loop NTPase [Helicobacter sp.]MDY5740346.1 P-loop NTPase [Helicobacter sp.]RAX55567.1 ATP-binding protein [Helicobacter sp. 10-6591]